MPDNSKMPTPAIPGERRERSRDEAASFSGSGSLDSQDGLAGSLGLLADIELEATLQFGSCEMPLKEILELGPGDVVELDRHISEPVDLVVGDRIVARGEVVVASGNFALRITEVATPQLRLESIRCLF
jgi:flagellar motor switch protein FliN/FliY